MATLVRIKRRRNEEPSESIGIAPKFSRIEESDAAASDPGNVTVLRRVGTLNAEDEPIESHLNQALEQEKKAWARRKSYKKASALASLANLKENQRKEAKSLSKSGRIKLVNAQREGLDKVANLFDGVIEEDTQPSEEEDVITCNGVPMKSEKADYVYDLYFTSVPVEHSSWMENICEFQRYFCDLVHEDELETHQDDYDYDDEDDENDENNWRNDYPEEDDDEEGNESDYLDADEYMASKMQSARLYDSDGSYDGDDYDVGFDEDGCLVSTGGSHMNTVMNSRMYIMRNQRRSSSSSDSSNSSDSDRSDISDSDNSDEMDSDDCSADDE